MIIEPLGPGTATLTVTGTLREWSSGSAGVQVTVTGEAPKPEEPETPETPETPEEPEVPEEPEIPNGSEPDQGMTEPGTSGSHGNSGNEDPFKAGAQGSGSGEGNQSSQKEQQLRQELEEKREEEVPLITKVPELSPQKNWKVYSLSDMDTNKDDGGRKEGPEDSLKGVAAGLGALLLGTGFIWKLLIFKGQI